MDSTLRAPEKRVWSEQPGPIERTRFLLGYCKEFNLIGVYCKYYGPYYGNFIRIPEQEPHALTGALL